MYDQPGLVRSEPCGAFAYYVLEREALAGLVAILDELGSTGTARRRPCA
jgi:hypothetical protein